MIVLSLTLVLCLVLSSTVRLLLFPLFSFSFPCSSFSPFILFSHFSPSFFSFLLAFLFPFPHFLLLFFFSPTFPLRLFPFCCAFLFPNSHFLLLFFPLPPFPFPFLSVVLFFSLSLILSFHSFPLPLISFSFFPFCCVFLFPILHFLLLFCFSSTFPFLLCSLSLSFFSSYSPLPSSAFLLSLIPVTHPGLSLCRSAASSPLEGLGRPQAAWGTSRTWVPSFGRGGAGASSSALGRGHSLGSCSG